MKSEANAHLQGTYAPQSMGIEKSTSLSGIRLGLCCLFSREDICFKTHTAKHLLKLSRTERLKRLSATIMSNIRSLEKAVNFCHTHSIGSFRINSRILPLKTHPEAGYLLSELPNKSELFSGIIAVGSLARNNNIRLTFHPDQFTLLSSVDGAVTKRSVDELLYHLEIAELLGADVITLHGGGAYGDKKSALQRVARHISQLALPLKEKLALENDDRIYTPEDLLPLCKKMEIPLVYDVHHHRCNPDGLSEEEATEKALATWNREPLFHISSPKDGWEGAGKRSHDDLINIDDFPDCWKNLSITVEVEAKAKEVAVLQLMRGLSEGRMASSNEEHLARSA
jgi:UV DNA damage endonuclease